MVKRTSIKDIANKLGISTATVSLVLSNKHKEGRTKVSEATAELIIKTGKEMNYQPNLMARSLKMGSTKTIGFVLADIGNPFFAKIASYVQKALLPKGYTVIILNTDESHEQMSKMISALQSRSVDGYIIAPTAGSESQIQALCESRVPLVLIDRHFIDIDTCNIYVDNYRAMYQSVSKLIENGAKKIAYISYEFDMIQFRDRKRGYIDATTRKDIYSLENVFFVKYQDAEANIEKIINEICNSTNRYDAVVSASISLSIKMLQELMRRNVNVGKDMKILSFDKSEVFDVLRFPISYIEQPLESIAQMAVEQLLKQIEDKDTNNKNTYTLPCTTHIKL